MATKTERILDLLPRTFRAGSADSPLGALTGTFGTELQLAENALAALMRAHWVDHADLGAPAIDDLARFAALYGLVPLEGDSVEEFRRRLKLWVRIILDGPATPRNLLRASGALLGTEFDDSDAAFDPWWPRRQPLLVTKSRSGRDAARLVLGRGEAAAAGQDAVIATITGRVHLGDAVDVSAGGLLSVAVDGGSAAIIDLAASAADPTALPVADIPPAIDAALGYAAATLAAGRLRLRSPGAGAAASLRIGDLAGDAAPALLGLPPRLASGTNAAAARFTGTEDLSEGADLSALRYIRIEIDGVAAEVDCASGAPGLVPLDTIRNAINSAFPGPVASHDGSRLALASASPGGGSRIAFQRPAAQDATALLFGAVPSIVVGADAAPAQITGSTDLSRGVDLARRCMLVIARDGGGPVTVDCAGAEPGSTQLPELVATINAATGPGTARQNGRNLILSGAAVGPSGTLAIGFAGDDDASEILLGLLPRQAQGADAVPARIEGAPTLGGSVNLWGAPVLRLAVDRKSAIDIDLGAKAADRAATTGAEIASAINGTLGEEVAGVSGDALVLQSTRPGATGHLAVLPLETTSERAFVSRIPLADDAASRVLGVASAVATGAGARPAAIFGTRNLARGADLRVSRYLRVSVDSDDAVDIDCAGPRPRATTAEEAAERINAALGAPVASVEAKRLNLVSPTSGAQSHIGLFQPRATDAALPLLGIETAAVRGTPASRPVFVGLVDLSAGVDLSLASHLRLAVDGGTPVEIDCAGSVPEASLPAQIALRINVALGVNIASHDNAHLVLTTATDGAAALLDILTPGSDDATRAILGIDPGRSYRGADAMPARIDGSVDLSGGADLSTAHTLRLSVDGGPPVDIDLAGAGDPAAVTLSQIAAAINAALGMAVASDEAGRLVLTSPSAGVSSRLAVSAAEAGDAREVLFGAVAASAEGTPAAPARIEGLVTLGNGVDLSEGAILPIVTAARSGEVELAGAVAEATSADEIVAAIEASGLAVASLTPEGRLVLRAPESDPDRLEVPARRVFAIEEYCPTERRATCIAAHGVRLRLTNAGAAAARATIEMKPAVGADAPGIVDIARGWELRYLAPLHGGETLRLSAGPSGEIAGVLAQADGTVSPVAPARILAAPLSPLGRLGDPGPRRAAPGRDGRRQIVLQAGEGPERTILTQRGGTRGDLVRLAPAAAVPASGAAALAGRLDLQSGEALLLADNGDALARLAEGAPAGATPGTVIAVAGQVSSETAPPTVLVARHWPVLDITIKRTDASGTAEREAVLESVVLARTPDVGSLAIDHRLAADPDPLMRGETVLAAEALNLARGGTEWIFVEADASRFDAASFGAARFAGPPRFGRGIFDACRFAEEPRADVTPVFAGPPPVDPSLTDLSVDWREAAPGSARIVLPQDLPRRFGARFDQDRFALADDAPLSVAGTVFEPQNDPDFIVARITADARAASLVTAAIVPVVPIGFAPVSAPFFTRVHLTGGRSDRPAQLYLDAPGLQGFVQLQAAGPGRWGNDITVAVCEAGPGRYDLAIAFTGARFENARAVVAGPPLTGRSDDLIAPGPRGVLHLKAGGVEIEVTRDGLPRTSQTNQQERAGDP